MQLNANKKIYQLLKIHLDLPEEDSEDEASKASETPEENAENSEFLLISVVENFYNCFMYSLFLICLFFFIFWLSKSLFYLFFQLSRDSVSECGTLKK